MFSSYIFDRATRLYVSTVKNRARQKSLNNPGSTNDCPILGGVAGTRGEPAYQLPDPARLAWAQWTDMAECRRVGVSAKAPAADAMAHCCERRRVPARSGLEKRHDAAGFLSLAPLFWRRPKDRLGGGVHLSPLSRHGGVLLGRGAGRVPHRAIVPRVPIEQEGLAWMLRLVAANHAPSQDMGLRACRTRG